LATVVPARVMSFSQSKYHKSIDRCASLRGGLAEGNLLTETFARK